MADADIDLYADDLEHEFNQDGDYNHDSNVDLYDDVITTPSEDHLPNDESRSSSGSHSPLHPRHHGKRVTLYCGNLTWWTTDQDVTDAIHTLGVNDILEIKFYENRANGQSKGFCVVSLGSENSLRTVMEKLPKKELHGQNPVVTSCNRQNLNHFEMQSRKGGHGMHSGNRHDSMNKNNSWDDRRNRDRERDRDLRDGRERNLPPERIRSRSNMTPAFQQQQRAPPGPPMHHPPPQGPPPPQYPPGRTPWMAGPPPQLHQMPPPHASRPGGPPMPNPSAPPPPPGIQAPPPPRPGPPPPGSMRLPPPRGPLPPMGPRSIPPPDPRAPPPSQHDWDRLSMPHAPPPQHVGMPPQPGPAGNRPPLPVQPPGQGMPPSIPPPAHHPPAPHINPAFFPPHTQNIPPGLPPTSQPADIYSRPPPMQFNDYRPVGDRSNDLNAPSVSDAEFEEIMGRNRTVSSSAIARAVSDASAGDYASAIETLVTAISLIKQSKVANDERCKILISSLQDTLHGIESKSYGSSRSKERPRSRERERSRERSSRREKSSRRDRSRSRDREYRDRSRERDRYHDDRYRDKDRDRDHDRDRRSSRH